MTPSVPSISADELFSGSEGREKAVEMFRENGFLRIAGIYSKQDVGEMKAEMERLVAEMDPASLPKSVFVASGDVKKVSPAIRLLSVLLPNFSTSQTSTSSTA